MEQLQLPFEEWVLKSVKIPFRSITTYTKGTLTYISLDYDIFVDGKYLAFHEAVSSYLSSSVVYEDMAKALNRKVPWHVRLKYFGSIVTYDIIELQAGNEEAYLFLLKMQKEVWKNLSKKDKKAIINSKYLDFRL